MGKGEKRTNKVGNRFNFVVKLSKFIFRKKHIIIPHTHHAIWQKPKRGSGEDNGGQPGQASAIEHVVLVIYIAYNL